jgi:hypothetical protein
MPTILERASARPADPLALGPDLAYGIEIKLDHLDAMLTDIGVWQHAIREVPDKRHGYSIDDQARALIVALGCRQCGIQPALCDRMGSICFEFLERASISDGIDAGRFHNFCDQQGRWLDSYGSDDSLGRTVWGLGVAYAADAPCASAGRVLPLLERSLALCGGLTPVRSVAFSILGLAVCRVDDALVRRLADRLADSYAAHTTGSWRWFESYMTYCNARLPLALFQAALVFPQESRYAAIAMESLDFLLEVMHNGKDGYAPIGNAPMTHSGWFVEGQARPPLFDQQPVDAGALVECCVSAYMATAEPRFRKAAYDAYAWYFGHNVHNLPLYDWSSGGVCDGLMRTGTNPNMGAESVISIWLARLALESV